MNRLRRSMVGGAASRPYTRQAQVTQDLEPKPTINLSPCARPELLECTAIHREIRCHDWSIRRWRCEAGLQYRVEYRDALMNGEWRVLDAIIEHEAGRARVMDVLPAGLRERYYRVRLE